MLPSNPQSAIRNPQFGSSQCSRRNLLGQFATGLSGIALTSLLGRDSTASPIRGEAADPPPHHPAKAKRAIQIFLQGGLSQVDSFDYKPELARLHGQPVPGKEKPVAFMGKVGLLHRHHFEFKQRGQSGLWVSDLFPHLAEVADELTVIRSMWSGTGNHTPATYEANSGFRTLGFPAAGTWISYGLGCEVDNLPTFVVLPDSRSLPTGGANNWTSGFLPARHQGVVLSTSGPPVRDLAPASSIDSATQAARFAALAALNRRHLELRGGDDALEGRLRSYELAARMQLAVPEAADLARESAATLNRYGVEQKECADFARGCLLARRLVERGVRFVQLWSGAAFGQEVHWDAHGSVPENHRREAAKIDRPVAALLGDLRERGLLDDTLVIFNTEFGRTPYAESAGDKAGAGRDHNADAFSVWLAGAGLRHGIAYGTSDDIGWKAAENPVDVHDFHATILHLLGIDHTRLTYYHNGIHRRLTNVHGRVLSDLLA
ncbi:MAG: DUF1501 domain-containing protein [Planctomycetaceae bacterium]|nr:DUF1501 domain-containing protein [Planctomycetaceae bacterium]